MGKGRERKENAAVPLRERIGTLFGIPADAVGLTNGFMAELRGQGTVTVRPKSKPMPSLPKKLLR